MRFDRRCAIAALLALMVSASPVAAEPVTLPNTEVRHLRAEANGIEYKIYVALPPRYAQEGRRYGVVYALDADYSFAIARNVVEHLSDRDHLEPLIVVESPMTAHPGTV